MLKIRLQLCLFLVLFSLPLFAEEESFTITTYYPSPYGSYNELQVYRSVTYKPVNKDTLTNPKEGEMVYNASDDSIYVYNGSSWVAQGAEKNYWEYLPSRLGKGGERFIWNNA